MFLGDLVCKSYMFDGGKQILRDARLSSQPSWLSENEWTNTLSAKDISAFMHWINP